MNPKTTIIFAALISLIGCVVINVFVWNLWSPAFILNDGVQYLSTAFNWNEGRGLYTNALMFTPHFQGVVPAPQTVWPPGYPLLISLISMLGMPIHQAALITNLVLHFVGAVLMLLIFLRWKIHYLTALLFTAAFYITATPWTYALALMSEPAFNAWILASILLLPNPEKGRLWLWLASGFFIALCVSTRYTGVFYALGVGLGTFIYCLRTDKFNRVGFIRCIGLIALQQSMAVAIFLYLQYRTYSLIGTLERQAGLIEPDSLILTLRKVVWQLHELAGFTQEGLLPFMVNKLLFVIFVLVFLWLLVNVFRINTKTRKETKTNRNGFTRLACYVILGHSAVFALFFTITSMGSNNVDLSHRYLYQIYPGLYILFCASVFKAYRSASVAANLDSFGKWLRRATMALCFLFVAAQINFVSGVDLSKYAGKSTIDALSAQVSENTTLSDFIAACFPDSDKSTRTVGTSVFGKGTLWSNDGQLMHLHTQVPTLTTAQVYANEPFDLAGMAEQIQMYDIKMFIFVNGMMNTEHQFVELMDGLKQFLVMEELATPLPMIGNQVPNTVSVDVLVTDQSCLDY